MSAGGGARVRALTPAGAGGVAVLRLEGAELAPLLARVGLDGGVAPGAVRLVRLREPDGPEGPGADLDEGLLVGVEPGVVELHLHGSPPLVRRVLDRLQPAGSEPADVGLDGEPGGEPDESVGPAARARALLPDAPSESGARVLLDQAGGALERELARLHGLDPEARRAGAAALLRRGEAVRWLLRPARVVLAGPVNAGKSTLFNVLLGEAHALTSDEAGTTRDALRRRARLGPWPVDLLDTAGERDLDDPHDGAARVERAGQDLARALRRDAQLVLWLRPPGADGRPVGPPAPEGTVELRTQADRGGGSPGVDADGVPRVSAVGDPEGARAAVRSLLERALDLDPEDLWRPGRAVPCDDAARDRVRGLLRDAPDAPR